MMLWGGWVGVISVILLFVSDSMMTVQSVVCARAASLCVARIHFDDNSVGIPTFKSRLTCLFRHICA
ncbi:hypothetical protein BJY01DRAFT_227431 [Aspergillus pseudoustus]|uniref:Amino acid permease/ SLC12A domain-containing protein n=1 Tax=Aspergillus pseudoustus TaxID=1810923 RepID=A0ABR4ITJ4_9EURO